MATLGEPIWPEVEYKVSNLGGEDYYSPVDWDAEIAWMDEQFDNQPTEGIKGCFVAFPMGDGGAIYKVTKLRPLTLSPVMFMDRYQAPGYTIRGIRKEDIERMIGFSRSWKKLTSNK